MTAALTDELPAGSGEPPAWNDEMAKLLGNLSLAQSDLLQLLGEKRRLLKAADREGLIAIAPREQELIDRLQGCQVERTRLLSTAAAAGLPSDSIRSLSSAVSGTRNGPLRQQIDQAQSQARLLQHQSLSNWVIVQRTMLHLASILEIIATGGRPCPTYGKGEKPPASGALVDRAA